MAVAPTKRTPADIRAEYEKLGALSKVGVAADDIVRIVANAATFGLADTVAGGDAAQRTADARTRAGLAGDIATGAGMTVGGGGALRVAKGAWNLARSGAGGGMALLRRAAVPLGLTGVAIADRVAGESTDTPAARVAPTEKAAPATAKAAVDQALAAGAAAPDPQGALGEYIANALKQGATTRQATALGALVPAAVKPGVSRKDALADVAAAVAADQFTRELVNARANATSEEDYAKRFAETQNAYFGRLTTLLGTDPTKFVLAERMGQQEDQ